MTTTNTLKALLTSDVGAAQAGIQRLIKTVEDMGKTVNANSEAGRKAFKAEADEVQRLVRELGAGEKQMARLTAARSAFAAKTARFRLFEVGDILLDDVEQLAGADHLFHRTDVSATDAGAIGG